jgi:type II secretory pathway component GspD/PulD (secretin)
VKILDQLDRRPKQVLIRGLVAEVNMTKLDNAGVDWATWGGSVTGDAILGGQLSMGETAIPTPSWSGSRTSPRWRVSTPTAAATIM